MGVQRVCRAQRAVRTAILAAALTPLTMRTGKAAFTPLTMLITPLTHYAHREVAHIGERNELARAPAVYLVEVDVLAHLALC